MAIALVGSVGTFLATVSNPDTVVLPSTPSADDLIVVACVTDGTSPTLSISGYTQAGTNVAEVVAAPDTNLAVFYKKAAGGEGNPSVTFGSTNGNFALAMLLSGVDTTTALDVAVVPSTLGVANANFTPTGLVTTTDNSWVLSFVANQQDKGCALSGTTQGFSTDSSHGAGGASYVSITGSDGSMGVASKIVTSAGAVTMPTWQTINGTDTGLWAGLSIALRDAAVVGQPTFRRFSNIPFAALGNNPFRR